MKIMKIIASLALVLAMVYSGFVAIQNQRQLNDLSQNMVSIEQQNAQLKDKIVALERQKLMTNDTVVTTQPQLQQQLNQHIQQLKQGFEFVQFALQQQQWTIALQRLEQIDQSIDSLSISEPLKLSLHQSILVDREQIKVAYQKSQQQQQIVQDLLRQLEQTLQQQLSLDYQPQEQKRSFWQRLWVIEKTAQPVIQPAQFQLLIKEIQLDVMMLKYLNVMQNPVEYQQAMVNIQNKMQHLPEPLHAKINDDVQKLAQIKILTLPKLSSLALLSPEGVSA